MTATDKMAASWTYKNGTKGLLKYKDEDLEYVATHAAENFYHHQDGNLEEWPLELQFYNIDDEYLGTVEVECNMEPDFHSTSLIDEI